MHIKKEKQVENGLPQENGYYIIAYYYSNNIYIHSDTVYQIRFRLLFIKKKEALRLLLPHLT
jgi:hypothetical protein